MYVLFVLLVEKPNIMLLNLDPFPPRRIDAL